MSAGRAAIALLVLVLLLAPTALWLLSRGSAAPPPGASLAHSATGRVVGGEVRSPDARTPLVRGEGLWRCETAGAVELRVSVEGLATLSLDGRLLASAFPGRALINRDCDARPPAALPPFRARRAQPGNSHLRCRVPRIVLVDLRDGDLTVRRRGRGRFLLGAALGERYIEPAAHWSAGCLLR